MNNLLKLAQNPQPFEQGTTDIWLDPERADLVLKTHLDENIPGGSKSEKFINQTVKHINTIMPPETHPYLLDLACGPGLYSQKLASLGYQVTGIDYNENSLDYAIKQAEKDDLEINYVKDDIINMKVTQEYDICLLLYHVYGSFCLDDRLSIIRNIHKSLKKGGYILLDVLSETAYEEYENSQIWYLSSKDNIFSEKKHITLASTLKYPDKVSLARNLIIFEDNKSITYNYWNQHFNIEDLENEVCNEGFTIEKIYGDFNGIKYEENGDQFAVLLKKL
ncbi:class I SAM-dependent methyltransferase [Mammaliicoccus sciuri]|uniref:class I SAM-dependent methyltransferase n=1 Tax=Mammaliicoccus sciuri TaxID=1296 RepID=UPI002DBD0B2D|nr:class I SAM-dependent methyltransferase [Mammaliicoccus sciuri]MEB5760065.1 class I SAM-dependent methyltransferase [Mammaliicoccus sciuri]HDF5210601.1 class I SAM-dependent methyltransferase [Staphylococcus aureus]